MSKVAVVGTSATYPLKGANFTRLEAAQALADHTGGLTNEAQLAKARRAWDRAVDDYNDVSWKFNIITQDFTLVNDDRDYALDTTNTFRTAKSCHLVDASSEIITTLRFSQFSQYLFERRDKSGEGGEPKTYYFQNAHKDGLIYFYPKPVTTITHPTARLFYHHWIEKVTSDTARLDVPRDVDLAIWEKALHNFMTVEKGVNDRVVQERHALNKRLMVERAHRDYKAIHVDAYYGY